MEILREWYCRHCWGDGREISFSKFRGTPSKGIRYCYGGSGQAGELGCRKPHQVQQRQKTKPAPRLGQPHVQPHVQAALPWQEAALEKRTWGLLTVVTGLRIIAGTNWSLMVMSTNRLLNSSSFSLAFRISTTSVGEGILFFLFFKALCVTVKKKCKVLCY